MPVQNNSVVSSFPFESLIWKISVDTQSNILALELRDHDNRAVDFAAIDLKTNEILWQGVKFEETWWLGLDSCCNGKIYLHTYKDPLNPEHEGIICLEAKTGRIAWKDIRKTIYHVSSEHLIAAEGNEDSKKYIGLDPATGKDVREFSLKEVFKITSGKKEQESERIRNPFHFPAEHAYFSKISDFIKEITGEQPVIAADYMENGEQVIISFYLYNTEVLSNHLVVVNDAGLVTFRACLASQIKGIGFDTFFVFEKNLIFVKEKKELIFLKIS